MSRPAGHGDGVYDLIRLVMRPLVKSYGVSSIITLSPGRTLIMLTFILPARYPKTTCPESSWTRKRALGKFSMTLPSSSIMSLFLLFLPKS
jgi:hypothetical protein